jgi:hypothetical protein
MISIQVWNERLLRVEQVWDARLKALEARGR